MNQHEWLLASATPPDTDLITVWLGIDLPLLLTAPSQNSMSSIPHWLHLHPVCLKIQSKSQFLSVSSTFSYPSCTSDSTILSSKHMVKHYLQSSLITSLLKEPDQTKQPSLHIFTLGYSFHLSLLFYQLFLRPCFAGYERRSLCSPWESVQETFNHAVYQELMILLPLLQLQTKIRNLHFISPPIKSFHVFSNVKRNGWCKQQ